MVSLRAEKKIDVTIPMLNGASGTVFFGSDSNGLFPIEILVSSTAQAPSAPEMRAIHKWRKNDRSNLVVVAIEAKGRVHLYGPSEDRQPIAIEEPTAKRVLQAALDDSTSLVARKNLVGFFDNFGTTEMAGIKNKGLFATHHLRDNLPQRKDWLELQNRGQALATKRHRELIKALGFEISTEERNTLILKAGPANQVIAVLLEDNENFDSPSGRFPSSPVAWGLSVAADHHIQWLIVLKKDQIRLHPGRDGVGVGQKGQAETFLELNLAQIDEEHLALLPLIFSASALEKDGDVQKILDESSKYAVVLGARLRERVYERVVPNISIAVAKKLQSKGLVMDNEGLQKAYSITLKILFRLLFQAYAEDRGLLPAGRNEGYDANSLKTIAKRDIEAAPEDFGNVVNIWHDLVQVWDSIDEGNPRWQVPAYNGGLFGRDPELHPEGALIKSLELTDKVLGPALQALLIDLTEDGVRGPVDFRSLSVREFGTIYEGLLESSLSLAEVDLTVDNKDAWVPAKGDDTVMAKAGEPYFHSASGERKATGSYFTPKFVVDHLVERAIDPTIDKHLEKISSYLKDGDQATAARDFFDFRVADLAMGSAHFLVAAVDRIEAKMRSFLSNPENMVPGVIDEISRLRKAATEALRGDEIAINEIEDPSLLRRQIARRCIYGIDINPMAVELARLAIWIHTFVPGLPMSTLNHNLVCGNTLTGIGTVDEALDSLAPNRGGQPTLFEDALFQSLEEAKEHLVNAANASEATKREVEIAAEKLRDARFAATLAKDIFDVAIATRLKILPDLAVFSANDLKFSSTRPEVIELSKDLNPAHLPFLFPEVFLRKNSGFDALLGNPPWEKSHIDKPSWWSIHAPETRGLKDQNLEREIERICDLRPDLKSKFEAEVNNNAKLRDALLALNFEGIGSAHVDLFQLFAWRNWQLLRNGGRIGVVLPRNAMSGPSLEAWRRTVIENGKFDSVLFAKNQNGWVFSIAHQLVVAFLVAGKIPGNSMAIGPVMTSFTEFQKLDDHMVEIDINQFKDWSESVSFPTLQNSDDIEIYKQLSKSPALDSWDFPVKPVSEFNSTTNRDLFRQTELKSDGTNVPIAAGRTFQIWQPDFGEPFAYGDTQEILTFLEERLARQKRSKATAFYGLQEIDLTPRPWDKARIFFRDIARSSDPRTGIFCLLPKRTFSLEGSPYLFIKGAGAKDTAFLLGVLSSMIFDWACRQWVDLHLKFYIIQRLPVPARFSHPLLGERLIELSAKLAAANDAFEDWAEEVGISPNLAIDGSEMLENIAEIDALVAILYGLSQNQLVHIFENFHRGWDYKPRLALVLKYFEDWKDK